MEKKSEGFFWIWFGRKSTWNKIKVNKDKKKLEEMNMIYGHKQVDLQHPQQSKMFEKSSFLARLKNQQEFVKKERKIFGLIFLKII